MNRVQQPSIQRKPAIGFGAAAALATVAVGAFQRLHAPAGQGAAFYFTSPAESPKL
jgi:hypothetical protein